MSYKIVSPETQHATCFLLAIRYSYEFKGRQVQCEATGAGAVQPALQNHFFSQTDLLQLFVSPSGLPVNPSTVLLEVI